MAASDSRRRSLGRARQKLQRQAHPLPPSHRSIRFDPLKTAELIEACRAHVERLSKLAGISSRTVFEYYGHESDEPELWECCRLVRQVLEESHTALTSLGVVSHETESLSRAKEIAMGCETQRLWLRPTVHVIRATIHLVLDLKPDFHNEVLPQLRHLERGLTNVVNELYRVIVSCPTGKGSTR